MKSINIITVTGPTASGKTFFAANLAKKINGEIISADSRQVYRQMDIGTGKDYSDYLVDGHQVPYHLIDIHEPGYKYNVFEFQQDFLRVFGDISRRGKMPLLVGGSGMYLEAVLGGYKLINVPVNAALRQELERRPLEDLADELKAMRPDLHNTTDTQHKKRTIRALEIALYYQQNPEIDLDYPAINAVIIGVRYDRQSQRSHISERLKQRLENGLVEEVRQLMKIIPAHDLMFYGLEYKFVTEHVLGITTFDEMSGKLEIAIHQFAKRQMTWFRKMERAGYEIHWIDGHASMDEKLERAFNIFSQYGLKLS